MSDSIAAIILAAGQSTRMGVPKMLLPWKKATVLDAVIDLAISAKLNPVVVVTGAFHELIENKLASYAEKVTRLHNRHYASREMFYSLKIALQEMRGKCDAAMIFLGDQPQISPDVVAMIIKRYQTTHSRIILPSYNMRRGHPILIHQYFFEEILSMPDTGSLKDFMNRNSEAIDYLVVNSREVLEDIDSPEDYDRLRKNQSS